MLTQMLCGSIDITNQVAVVLCRIFFQEEPYHLLERYRVAISSGVINYELGLQST